MLGKLLEDFANLSIAYPQTDITDLLNVFVSRTDKSLSDNVLNNAVLFMQVAEAARDSRKEGKI